MHYALIDMRGTCAALTTIAWGSLKQIADTLISACEDLMRDTDDMPPEELENVYYCDFGDYRKLKSCDAPTLEMIRDFSFTLSDCTIGVAGLVDGYPELIQAFAAFSDEHCALCGWRMVPHIEETDGNLAALNDELQSLCDDMPSGREYRFFVQTE